MFTTGFWKDLGERTVATFAQALLAILSVLALQGGGLAEVEWGTAFSVAGLAALLAVLKGLVAASSSATTGASFGTTVPKPSVAAVEEPEVEGQYVAEEAAPVPEGTPVEVVAETPPVGDGATPVEHPAVEETPVVPVEEPAAVDAERPVEEPAAEEPVGPAPDVDHEAAPVEVPEGYDPMVEEPIGVETPDRDRNNG